jgi:hypothetical protein
MHAYSCVSVGILSVCASSLSQSASHSRGVPGQDSWVAKTPELHLHTGDGCDAATRLFCWFGFFSFCLLHELFFSLLLMHMGGKLGAFAKRCYDCTIPPLSSHCMALFYSLAKVLELDWIDDFG